MLKKISIAAVVLIAVIMVYVATQPDDFSVMRTASIEAPPEKIFPLINDLRSFNSWNPFDKKDPDIRGSYSGPAGGRGATYAFAGNKDVGAGSLEIIESSPPSRVTMKLDMTEPMEAHNIVQFILQPAGDATNVTWAMNGKMPFIGKVLHLVFDMDRMVGSEFESGLANLKVLTE